MVQRRAAVVAVVGVLTGLGGTAATAQWHPLDEEGDWRAQWGGQTRVQHEYARGDGWDTPAHNPHGVLLTRIALRGGLEAYRRVRVHADVRSAFAIGREDASIPEEDRASIHELFAELYVAHSDAVDVSLRGGRQQLRLGSGRFVDIREGPNVRLTFDGVSVRAIAESVEVLAFALWPTNIQPGVFDNETQRETSLSGLQLRVNHTDSIASEFLALAHVAPGSVFEQGTGHQTRYTVGTRVAGAWRGWDFDVEAAVQFGELDGVPIRAWTLASTNGYRWALGPWWVRVGLRADIASGDSNPDDDALQTFDAMYPRGDYFGAAALLGPANFFDIHPAVTVGWLDRLSLGVDWGFFWRLERRDAVYSPPGFIQLTAEQAGPERFVGSNLSATVEWAALGSLTVAAVYSHFFVAPRVGTAAGAQDIDFFQLTVDFNF